MEGVITTPISIVATSAAEADRLLAGLDGFQAYRNGGDSVHEVDVQLDADTTTQLISLFDAIGRWVGGNHASSCQVRFGERSYNLLAVQDGDGNGDPTQFLLERTIQLQRALDTRIVIEQAKGRLAERFDLSPEDAFELLRRGARGSGQKIQVLAKTVSRSSRTPPEIESAR